MQAVCREQNFPGPMVEDDLDVQEPFRAPSEEPLAHSGHEEENSGVLEFVHAGGYRQQSA